MLKAHEAVLEQLKAALEEDFIEVAVRYIEAREEDEEETADDCLEELRLIGKVIKYTVQMMDCTMGKMLLPHMPK